MTARFFIDTNILLYAGSNAPEDVAKRGLASTILRKPEIGFSAQVLQEYFDVAYRKHRLGITLDEAIQALRELARKPVLPITSSLVIQAAELSNRFQISCWDAAIVAAAKELACEAIYSEDLNHGQESLLQNSRKNGRDGARPSRKGRKRHVFDTGGTASVPSEGVLHEAQDYDGVYIINPFLAHGVGIPQRENIVHV